VPGSGCRLGGQGAARLARDREGREPDCDPRHGIPHTFSHAVLHEAEAARPVPCTGARTGARFPSSPSIRPCQGPRRRGVCAFPIPTRKIQAASSSMWRLPMSPTTSRPARRSTPRGDGAGQFGLFPGSGGADAARAHLQRPLLAQAGVDRPAMAVRMVIGADGRKREHRFHRVLIRSLAKLHYAQVQARRRPAR